MNNLKAHCADLLSEMYFFLTCRNSQVISKKSRLTPGDNSKWFGKCCFGTRTEFCFVNFHHSSQYEGILLEWEP